MSRTLNNIRRLSPNAERELLIPNGHQQASGFSENDDVDDIRFLPAIPHTENYLDDNDADSLRQILIAKEPPADNYNCTYLVFYLLGMATLTPWNFFVTVEDYWLYKFRNTTENATLGGVAQLTSMQKNINCAIGLTAAISSAISLVFNVVCGQRVVLRLKMLGTLFVALVGFIGTTALVEVNTDNWQLQFFLLTLLIVLLMNICASVMAGGMMGIVSLFPAEYLTAAVCGPAIGSILSAIAFLLVLGTGAKPTTTAFIYFIIGSVLTLASMLSYAVVERRPFFKYYLTGGNTLSHRQSSLVAGNVLEPNIADVFGQIYVHVVSVCLLFTTTLAVYPGVTVLMQSAHHGTAWNDVYFLPVVNYLLYNAADYFGRLIAGIWELPSDNPHTILLICILRVLYLPFFLCSNSDFHRFLPVLVHTDMAFTIMIVTFGLTNGYFANNIQIKALRAVKQHEKQLASSILITAVYVGLAVGSMLSLVFVQLL